MPLEAIRYDLEKEEITWRLKRRAIWIQEGDNNTNFFHQYVNNCKNFNTIWEIQNHEGEVVRSFKEKVEAIVHHFKSLFKEPQGCPIHEILQIFNLILWSISDEMNNSLEAELAEELSTLSSMKKGKSHDPNVLSMEFYLGFYDLLKGDLLKVVGESQRSGKMPRALNSTFIALIPKKQDALTFDDHRSISCCNVIYKPVSKIMTQRLKPILIELISKEQFGFLQHRQIHDAMALAQEALHSIKLSKQEAVILKINLSKAYYRVNWTYLHLILLQLGINLNTLNWIMGCVQSVSFLDLINGTPSNLFCALQGLRQGCPLSPFLFLLVAYGLSKLIVGVKSKGELIGI
jgi:hypothetical protein